ncbi:glutaminase A [Candidatus Berkiella aquae]|uniref:Glutaminase n=1 Tax=Candidatus Berkiella aquae TaxID=295108 RepID=A0A0Q9YZ75_9GAMM|nr:glutaminase A [Candidatus Berkiella aquae]
MERARYLEYIQKTLDEAVLAAKQNREGAPADYIPELANVDPEQLSAAIQLVDGTQLFSGDHQQHLFTLQSVAKLISLIGLMEEYGEEKMFSWIHVEPSGQSFSSIAQVDRYGPIPVNPMVNAGAIALCSRIPGNTQQRAQWLDGWAARLFGQILGVNGKVFASERATGDRNRSIAYLLNSKHELGLSVEESLETYFYLCSYEADIKSSVYLPMLLANGGLAPDGTRVISERTSNSVVAIMATCGMYDESGMNLVKTGMPAKSGVSGLVVALATGRGGIAICSPRLNDKGGSVRAQQILTHVSQELDWHFAAPWGYMRAPEE